MRFTPSTARVHPDVRRRRRQPRSRSVPNCQRNSSRDPVHRRNRCRLVASGELASAAAMTSANRLNQILSEMDGFAPSEAVIVIAATTAGRPRPRSAATRSVRSARDGGSSDSQGPRWRSQGSQPQGSAGDDVNLDEIAGGTIASRGQTLKNSSTKRPCMRSREQDGRQSQRLRVSERQDRDGNQARRDPDRAREADDRLSRGRSRLIGWILPDVDPVYKVTIVPRGGHWESPTSSRTKSGSAWVSGRCMPSGHVDGRSRRGDDGLQRVHRRSPG